MSELEPLGLPSPSDEPTNGPEDHDRPQSETSRSRPRRVRSDEELLFTLDQLAGLVALGVMAPAQANAIRGLMLAILSYRQRAASGSPTAATIDRDLLERLRHDPQLMNMMAPLLTPEQIATLMGDTTDGPVARKLKFCTDFIHLRRQLIDFDGRPYLPAIYGVTDRNLVLRCSRQIEKSTFLANTIVFEACTRPGVQMLVVCPREEQARRFSHDRLLPAIKQSPLVHPLLLGTTRRDPPVMNMEFRNGSRLFLRAAYNSADACRGLSADLLLVDELQDIAAGHLPVLQETLSHAVAGRTILVGTPKSVENHLEAMFSQSTANEWHVPCEQCRRGVVVDERCLGPVAIVCPNCQGPLDPTRGEWVPRNPAARWGEGFCVNHLMVPWLNYDDILERQRSYDLIRFKNEVLGLPSTTGDQVVTRAELEACCGDFPMAQSLDDISPAGRGQLVAGIDWGGGGTSRTVLVIGWMRSDYRFQVCRLERFEAHDEPGYVLDQLAQRCQQFQVRLIAADGGGNGNVQNRLLVDKLGGYPNLYGIYYSMSDHEPQRDGVLTKWTVNRTATIGFLFTRIKRQMICFPRTADCGRFLDEFACEIAEYDDVNRSPKYTHPSTQQDDALHATNYALLVATRAFVATAQYAG